MGITVAAPKNQHFTTGWCLLLVGVGSQTGIEGLTKAWILFKKNPSKTKPNQNHYFWIVLSNCPDNSELGTLEVQSWWFRSTAMPEVEISGKTAAVLLFSGKSFAKDSSRLNVWRTIIYWKLDKHVLCYKKFWVGKNTLLLQKKWLVDSIDNTCILPDPFCRILSRIREKDGGSAPIPQ